MDEWTIKTPNPICRLFFKIDLLTDFAALCSTDFIDWRYIHSVVCIFDPGCELLPPWMKEQYLYLCTVAPLCRLHTAILDRPPSSAATMEVQGPDTKWRGIQGILFLACQWCMGTICILWPLLRNRWLEGLVGTPSPPSNQHGPSPPPSPLGYIPRPLQTDQGEASLREIVLRPLIRGRRPQQHLEEDVETILGFSAPLYEVRQLSWRPAQVDQRASS